MRGMSPKGVTKVSESDVDNVVHRSDRRGARAFRGAGDEEFGAGRAERARYNFVVNLERPGRERTGRAGVEEFGLVNALKNRRFARYRIDRCWFRRNGLEPEEILEQWVENGGVGSVVGKGDSHRNERDGQ
jgi:hypothetical protein